MGPAALGVRPQNISRGRGEMQAENRAREELKRASAMMALWNDAQLGGTLVMIQPSHSQGERRCPRAQSRAEAPRNTSSDPLC